MSGPILSATHTEAEFDQLSWHDCHIWGFELRAGNPDDDDWTSDFAFDIDFIVEWICGVDGGAQFKVAPATLVFHGVTDPRIDIACETGVFVSLHPLSMDRVDRVRVEDQKVYLDRPYYEWTIRLSWPSGGCVAFGAVGFTQTLQAEPLVTERQCLSRRLREHLKSKRSSDRSMEET